MIPAAAEVVRFRTAILRGMGLTFDDSKLGSLAEILQRRVEANGGDLELYLCRLEDVDRAAAEHRELARDLTVPETYFFRHTQQLRAFVEAVLPERVRARASVRQLRVLCAGCASGEEAYSLAILLLEQAVGWNVAVRAADVNPVVLEKARQAQYSPWSLRETSSDLQRRYFVARGRELVLDPAVRAVVTFEERNLVRDDGELFAPGSYDVVFCRNVLMYLAPESAAAVVARLARSLVPGGYLFLGHAETLRGLSQDFHLRHTHESFYYQRKDGSQEPGLEVLPAAVPLEPPSADWSTNWIDTVHRAADRIRILSERPADAPAEAASSAADLRAPALALLAQERFAEALLRLGAETPGDPETLLLRAVLLTHGGRANEAEEVCARLLALDELNAGAHYVLALCRESANDPQAAIDHDSIAAYLDPTFAMPRLHLGLMARRAGDREAAQRELEQASRLLTREDPSRLLLFGGGFGREPLIALCRAELLAAGARP